MMHSAKKERLPAETALFSAPLGFSLVELLVTMAIFGILMTGIFQAYIAQMQNTTREYGIAESDIDRQVGQGIIYRDIFMAGYGLADDYGGLFTPWALQSEDGGPNSTDPPDTLTLMGTALGMNSQQAQHWSFATNVSGADFQPYQWRDALNNADARENLQNSDMVIMIEPGSKRLLTEDTATIPWPPWLYKYIDGDDDITTAADNHLVTSDGSNLNPVTNNAVIYGLYKDGSLPVATLPYYAVRYYITDQLGDGCVTGARNLLRAESRTSATPDNGEAVIPCVADFQVALGLDTDNDRDIDLWHDGGVTAGEGYDPARLNRSLRQVRVYALTQIGDPDRFYTYPSSTIYVGDESLGIGRPFSLSDEQRRYRWRVIRFVAVPRNIR
jgi:prepilin-type N-terminal cleavage/methylation domain-containing protein